MSNIKPPDQDAMLVFVKETYKRAAAVRPSPGVERVHAALAQYDRVLRDAEVIALGQRLGMGGCAEIPSPDDAALALLLAVESLPELCRASGAPEAPSSPERGDDEDDDDPSQPGGAAEASDDAGERWPLLRARLAGGPAPAAGAMLALVGGSAVPARMQWLARALGTDAARCVRWVQSHKGHRDAAPGTVAQGLDSARRASAALDVVGVVAFVGLLGHGGYTAALDWGRREGVPVVTRRASGQGELRTALDEIEAHLAATTAAHDPVRDAVLLPRLASTAAGAVVRNGAPAAVGSADLGVAGAAQPTRTP